MRDSFTDKQKLREEQTKPKVSRRKEVIKIRSEINKRLYKTIEKINETKKNLEEKVGNDVSDFIETQKW